MTLLGTSDAARSRAAALVAALLVAVATWNVLLNTLVARTGIASSMQIVYDLVVPLSRTGAAGGLLAATVAIAVLLAALARTVAPDVDALGAGETPLETALAYGRAVVVALAGTLAAGLGLALLVVPGLVVLVHLPLVFVAVATDGTSILQAVERTRARARGSRPRIAAVCLAVVAVPLALAVIATLTALVAPVVELALGVLVTTAAAAAGIVAFTALANSLGETTPGGSRTDRVAPGSSRQL
ncbi:hypothetical protein SAMN04488065_1300 [Haloplanus vescus]|uniref:Glycerophosphoryl diester phosphodiesterase membrane domain-containing protein n=1 Tax=Haloplanus vescus TaxID=555874 RepID=A0A1H3X3Y6_9EURY|nr:hypothetical protein [Haloplanus vescus]SDZ93334.1 hypothetical protein SAMN04488065_1300 [Haloplanus vescus]